MFDSMVNEFAHNAYVNKSEGLDMNLQVSFRQLYVTTLYRTTLTAIMARKVEALVSKAVARKRNRFHRSATRSTETTLKWVTSFKKMKTKWISSTT